MNAPGRIVRAVFDADQFNALRHRLPRATRRSVEPAPADHIGLIVQIVSGDDQILAVTWSHIPATADASQELSRLETQARERLY
jgi:hypothetical protein